MQYITTHGGRGIAAGKEDETVRWKYVMDGRKFESHIDASVAAGKAGYRFFLYDTTVYFRDVASLRISDTGLTESDLI